jgi:hypothetical protein
MRYLTFVLIITILFIVGCASPQPTQYKSSSTENEFGYKEKMLTDTQYRIDFIGNRHTDESRIKDYAMLRAAELTLLKGFDWFVILDSDTERQTKSRTDSTTSLAAGRNVVRECGLLGCSSYSTPVYTGMGISTYEVDGKVSTSLQIAMGKGEPKDPNAAFNAQKLADNLRKNIE